MSTAIIIFAPEFDPDIGGAIVLHKLCHVLNEVGANAFIFPAFREYSISAHNWVKPLRRFLRRDLLLKRELNFNVSESFNTPIISSFKELNRLGDYVVLYPDYIVGNPLAAKRVVRWLLHDLGHHMGEYHVSAGELHFRFQGWIKSYCLPGVMLSEQLLRITHFPIELYNMVNAVPVGERRGVAYCIRKGKGKVGSYDCDHEAVLIDGKSHQEIASIFKRVKTFVSFDAHTAYSKLAVLCGCDSVVIPDSGVEKGDWQPEERHRYGIAYGFDDLEYARKTAHKVLNEIQYDHDCNRQTVKKFLCEVCTVFGLPEEKVLMDG